MTKTVRIENADTGRDKNVRVEVWLEGTPSPSFVRNLGFPTAMTDICISTGTYVVIREEDIPQLPEVTANA